MSTDAALAPRAAAQDPARPRATRAVAWAVLPVYLAGATAYLVLNLQLGSPDQDLGQSVVLLGAFGMFAGMGAVLLALRPRNAVGWVMAGAALLLALGASWDAYAAWVMTTSGRPDVLAVLGALVQQWYWMALLYLVFAVLPLIFPDGRLPSRGWRWPAAVGLVGVAGLIAVGMLQATLTGQKVNYEIDNPIGIEGWDGGGSHPLSAIAGALFVVGVLTAVLAVAVRFRRSHGEERQQMKWFVCAVAPLALIPVIELLPAVVGAVWQAWIVLTIPVAVAIAVLRYRLDGIDVVINRTLVYGTLTAGIVGVYVLVVGYLGAALRREDDPVVSLVATGVVAVLFAPARDRLQTAVDRLLYGHRAEPYAAMAQLGERLEGTLAPEAVLPTIVSTVREALRLPYAAIRLAGDDQPVSAGTETTATQTLALLHHGARVGELVLGLRLGEDTFSAADRRLLADLARQAGVAVSAVRLTADLQRSRERLVTAREEERRRLRRDLHDGLGAQLAGLTVQAGVLRPLIGRDPVAAEALAVEMRAELRTAIADIRRLVHGLRPPAIDELGLAGALERLAERSGAEACGTAIDVDVPAELPTLPAAVEVAAYRIAQEALTNVVRHAAARTCTVRLAVDPGELVVEVTDDGTGLPDGLVPGVGTASMRERAAETGGECLLGRAPGGGTRVLARLPRVGGN